MVSAVSAMSAGARSVEVARVMGILRARRNRGIVVKTIRSAGVLGRQRHRQKTGTSQAGRAVSMDVVRAGGRRRLGAVDGL